MQEVSNSILFEDTVGKQVAEPCFLKAVDGALICCILQRSRDVLSGKAAIS